ncbi:uncharacterized protein [Musca autumnalis]|uniref:uncharacterized protein n=1 Tax=Musca autumnalis TaxID=221902 RepID=UPI003CF5AC68
MIIMDAKKLLLFVTLLVIVTTSSGQTKTGLRRKPKIYNALITTDENLVQSRAYPVIQPTIHESGIAHYAPFGPYGPYTSYYNPHVVRFGQPIAPHLMPKEQLPYPLPVPQFPPQIMGQPLGPQPQPYPGYPLPPNAPAPETKPAEAQTPPTAAGAEAPAPTVQPPTMLMAAPAPKDPKSGEDKMPSEQLPIPLNQYGLPPSLIPLRQPVYPQPQAAAQSPYLPPYAFNQYPPLYYKYPPVLRQQFLPPYGYLPTGPQFPLSNAIPKDDSYPTPAPQLPPTPPAPQPQPSTEAATPPPPPPPPTPADNDEAPSAPDFEAIKNGSKSADSNVPDVPPPPIPSGAKSKQA